MPICAASSDVERTIRRLCDEGRDAEAVTLALRTYGAELRALLATLLEDEEEVREAYAVFGEQLWISHGRFQWRSSYRSWAYVIAKRVALRTWQRRRVARRRTANGGVEPDELAYRPDTEPPSLAQGPRGRAVVARCEALSAEERQIVRLRLEYGLSWRNIALTMMPPEEATSDAAVARGAARYRKRFERIRAQLRAVMVSRGLDN